MTKLRRLRGTTIAALQSEDQQGAPTVALLSCRGITTTLFSVRSLPNDQHHRAAANGKGVRESVAPPLRCMR